MKYFFTGSIKKLRENGFVVYREKDKQWTYANRGYENDWDNSLFIWLGTFPTKSYLRKEIVFNVGGKNKTDLTDHINDLIEKGLVRVEEDDNNKSN